MIEKKKKREKKKDLIEELKGGMVPLSLELFSSEDWAARKAAEKALGKTRENREARGLCSGDVVSKRET